MRAPQSAFRGRPGGDPALDDKIPMPVSVAVFEKLRLLPCDEIVTVRA
jgi:hypothetical protein